MKYDLDVRGSGWELAGYQGVDSGTVIISDPCYVLADEERLYKNGKPYDKTYTEFLDDTIKREAAGESLDVRQPWGDGSVTILSTTYGDGSYPIYIQRNHEGRPTAILIDLAQELGGVYEDDMDDLDECPYCGDLIGPWDKCSCAEEDAK